MSCSAELSRDFNTCLQFFFLMDKMFHVLMKFLKLHVYRGSHMGAHVVLNLIVLNLLNELGKKIRCKALLSILSVFTNKFNKFSNTGA